MSLKVWCAKIFLVSAILVCSSCDKFSYLQEEQTILAEAYGDYLYEDDIKGLVPPNTSDLDSQKMVHAYVQNWIKQKVLVHKAKQNLSEQESQFEKQLKEYKNSLLIFAYQAQVTDNLLDTVVSKEEIEAYYKEHLSQFYLKNNIVRVQFVKIKKDNKELTKIKKLLFEEQREEEMLPQLSNLCKKNAENYFLDGAKWLFFNEFIKEVPIKTYDQEDFLKNNAQFEVLSGDYIYMVKMLDFKIKESVSPLSFQEEKIKNILLNQRKQLLLEKINREVLQDALNSKEVKNHTKK